MTYLANIVFASISVSCNMVEQLRYCCFQAVHCPKGYPAQMDDQHLTTETAPHLEGKVVANSGLFGSVYGDCHDNVAAVQPEFAVVPKILRLPPMSTLFLIDWNDFYCSKALSSQGPGYNAPSHLAV